VSREVLDRLAQALVTQPEGKLNYDRIPDMIYYNPLHITTGESMAKPTSVRLDDELARKLDTLAAATDRPKVWLIEQAVRRYVEEQSWQIQAISEALAEYDSGASELVPHERVMQELEARMKAAQK
jgi:predicted transcriptional regulator